MSSISLTLRPLDRKDPPSPASSFALEGAFRLHISPKEFKNLGLSNGQLIRISTSSGHKGFAVAWLLVVQNAGNKPLAKGSDLLREKYGLALNEPISVAKVDDPWKPIEVIEVSCPASSEVVYESTEQLLHWIRYALSDLDIILPGCTFDVQKKGPRFRQNVSKIRVNVDAIKPTPDAGVPIYFDPEETVIQITSAALKKPIPPASPRSFRITEDGTGGLSHHVKILNRDLALLTNDYFSRLDPYLSGPTAFLIHGPEGTGKSLLLKKLAGCDWANVLYVDISTSTTKTQSSDMTKKFEEARSSQPSLIVMDDLDKYLGKAETLVGQLRAELEKLEGSKVVVAAAARSVYDVDASLRTNSTLNIQLEIFPPNVKDREEILRAVFDPVRAVSNLDFISLAERTHGFVGRDIHTLCGKGRKHHIYSLYEKSLEQETGSDPSQFPEDEYFVTQEDIDAVIDQVLPSVLKGSILEVPKVRWTDIAGLDHVRKVLEAITIRPYKYPDLEIKFGGTQSRKGVLLYGPPGCAKTLIAQAVATESNQNFLAVKGSELIKMYVGESERAIRDVFRRARAAKPCIIFFDEIDAIGKSRDKSHDSGLNVVTTLLNEMDGIEALKQVSIIGATNRPDVLDSALIRPGRFDARIHIGLPNEAARKQILEIHNRKQPLADDVDLSLVASKTDGSSGADISGLCAVAREMAMFDYEEHPEAQPETRMCHFLRALDQHIPTTDRQKAARYEDWRPGMSLSASD
ncbi:P-loop containing nucleoside triphosphate hydrolase protein [Dendryphion nanum]|uniref:P-loop containing nucleoside triphosphate hydrolase protein n=1 Tax=Dendryphion nanum TaxID=256645 RepID=A0A9P9ELP2_9PLEO|nr:P-loop containing nucleoside triphosphate hydrolase protein [Dendryphion nanum]